MKKRMFSLLVSILILSLTGCQKTLRGTDELIEKARKEIPFSNAESIKIQYAGECHKDDAALIWFIAGNEDRGNYYFPMECKIAGENEYIFVSSRRSMDRGEDIGVLQWKGGYSFLINNPHCRTVKIIDNSGTRVITIDKDDYPFVIFNEEVTTGYYFLDEAGNEIR